MTNLMTNFICWDKDKLSFVKGISIQRAAESLSFAAWTFKQRVTADFNEIPMVARPGDSVDTILELYALRRDAYQQARYKSW